MTPFLAGCDMSFSAWENESRAEKDIPKHLYTFTVSIGVSPYFHFFHAGLLGDSAKLYLLEWMRFVIFRARRRERSQRTSGPISE